MKKIHTCFIGCLSVCAGIVYAAPVKVAVHYFNIQALSNKLTAAQCSEVIKDATFQFDQDKPKNIKVNSDYKVKDSRTVIKTMDGKDQVLVKLGKAFVHVHHKHYKVNRISYVKIEPNQDATGTMVLEGLCRTDFSSKRAS